MSIAGMRLLKCLSLIFVVMLVLVLLLASYVLVDISPKTEPLPNSNNLVNDVTQLNPIKVSKVISPKSIESIQKAIKGTKGKISIGGGRYSQGGQIALADHLHLDMRAVSYTHLTLPTILRVEWTTVAGTLNITKKR